MLAILTALVAAIVVAATPAAEAREAWPLFGRPVKHAILGPQLTAQSGFARVERRLPLLRRCLGDRRKCPVGLLPWHDAVTHLRGEPVSKILEEVNWRINYLVPYQRDIDLYGRTDYWADPLEVVVHRGGDCEDYALFKYATLRLLGVPEENMRVAVVMVPRVGVHAVLEVRTETGVWILDNIRDTVVRDRDLPDYEPLYAVMPDEQVYVRRTGK